MENKTRSGFRSGTISSAQLQGVLRPKFLHKLCHLRLLQGSVLTGHLPSSICWWMFSKAQEQGFFKGTEPHQRLTYASESRSGFKVKPCVGEQWPISGSRKQCRVRKRAAKHLQKSTTQKKNVCCRFLSFFAFLIRIHEYHSFYTSLKFTDSFHNVIIYQISCQLCFKPRLYVFPEPLCSPFK